MKYLLDTHAFLWWLEGNGRLSDKALRACEDAQNSLYLSLASIWELQLKIDLGKLKINDNLPAVIDSQCAHGLQLLTIKPVHIYALNTLPVIHTDPFDRLLVAQALQENMVLITTDQKIAQYPVKTLW